MEVKIGIVDSMRELVVEVTQDVAEVQAAYEKAVKNSVLFALSDSKGRTVVVPSERVAYLDFSGETKGKVGFGIGG